MTTASLHREMVQALENARDYPSGCDCMVYSETTAWERHDWDCVRYVAGVALDGWERRERLRDDPALERAVYLALFGGATEAQDFFDQATLAAMRTEVVRSVLDALDPLLYGERG